MDLCLTGKNLLITGGSSGIGKGIATVLAQEGVNLAIASRNPDPGAIEELRACGTRVEPIRADVSKEHEAVGMVEEAIRRLGHLDFYVNNAAWTWHQPITKIDSDSWYNTINTNLSAAMWGCRTVARHMIKRRQGSIVIVSSTCKFASAYCETSYRVSKFGLTPLMQNLCVELAPYGIRVNMVTPGHFVTRMTGWDRIDKKKTEQFRDHYIPLRRYGQTTEVGAAVALLLSDKVSGYTTGADIAVDGGLQHSPIKVITDDDIRALNEQE
ncbi:MAG: SDR family oxidoreductase [Kiritimatiellia bacterium]|jgi:NAD(P)-dependent dehydrogenase (short-subunit alcohol dehydrogenase family)|nr:SDR family oxidoreductase [Kiritimatiellia bacterium]